MLIEIVLALGYNSIDKRLPANETKHSQSKKETETEHSQQKKGKKKKKKQGTDNTSASHRTHRTLSRPFSSASHRTHRVRTSKRIHMEHIESDQNRAKKKRAPNVERERLTKRQTA